MPKVSKIYEVEMLSKEQDYGVIAVSYVVVAHLLRAVVLSVRLSRRHSETLLETKLMT